MEINKIEFLDISVKLPVSIDLDLRVDFYSTERNRLIEQINFLKSVVNYPQPKGCEFQVFASTGLRVPRYH